MNKNEVLSVKKNKRRDIQCLRALAIVGVLGFHLKPKLFPQGFLGVDMFFVISGYLMTSILNFPVKKNLTVNLIQNFYIRRIKRIVPVYLLVIFLTFVICSFYLTEHDYVSLKEDTVFSVFFISNIQSMLEKEVYFKQVRKPEFLLHTWSLSVEIQYYLFAPFLLYVINKMKYPTAATYVISVISWIFQVSSSDHTVAFGFVFSRLWQFLIGTIVFYSAKNSENIDLQRNESQKMKNINYLTTVISLILILLLPIKVSNVFYEVLIRSVSTVLTGRILFLENKHNLTLPEAILDALSFVGDISYSLYLIHWPIVVLAKYLMVYEKYSVFIFIFVIFAISILQYKMIETKLLKLSNSSTVLFIFCCYSAIMVALLMPQGFGFIDESTIPDYVAENEKILKDCNYQLENLRSNCTMDPPFTFPKEGMPLDSYLCSFEGNGTGTIMVMGNSFAMRQVYGLMKELKGNYKRVYIAAQSMCTVFLELNIPSMGCNYVISRLMEIMQLVKPDVTIVTQRLSVEERINGPLPSLEAAKTDNTTQIFREYWESYSNFTKQILIIEPHPTFQECPKGDLAKLFKPNQSLDDYFVSQKDLETEVNPGWWRTVASIDKCEICSVVPTRKYFLHKDGKYDIYDKKTKLTLFCDYGHYSLVGSARFMPDLVRMIDFDLLSS